MKPPDAEGVSLTINGGSSSVKFALFSPGPGAGEVALLRGEIERIGSPAATLVAKDGGGREIERREFGTASFAAVAQELTTWIRARLGAQRLIGIGHRIVHGGLHVTTHQIVTPLMGELRRSQPLDLAHLPGEIALIEAFGAAFTGVPQIACFDTVFHHDMPRVAQLLPIPRRYLDAGVRRLGFHGLSYAYLMGELTRIAGAEAAKGKIILAHLGSGASMAAVDAGKPIDTTMAFTPTAGLVMGTRPGDMDPGLLAYLIQKENFTADQLDDFLNRHCGMLGVSDTSADMRDLLTRRATDPRAADAVNLFCHQARKWIGALAATLGGLDTLVFSGGIGEHAPEVRADICAGLTFLGATIDAAHNAANAGMISTGRVAIRVIPTDEEVMIARIVRDLTPANVR